MDLNMNFRDLNPSPGAATALRALEEAEMPKLSGIQIVRGHFSSSPIFSLLRKYRPALRSLKIESATLDKDVEMDTMLAVIRDELRMDQLVLECLEIRKRWDEVNAFHRPSLYRCMVMRREDGCFRSKAIGKLEDYSLGNDWVTVSGQLAVKLAVNEVMQRRESTLYDPRMTRKVTWCLELRCGRGMVEGLVGQGECC
ncbi:hypothetical protein CERZMDRAFT_100855 [Cercospora zeae-maydis SCOH1-5]|uniref:Uncharacterized protein n=1 Tax=Cercospora zeae-maydis SCOH1-5 TaxID=717836 RepID=A0A6A6F5T0_9PEZI|nr:hypothetical protein CERZMDRAFT_100855 [Cercospora zeae-maydis SCOH1-5]